MKRKVIIVGSIILLFIISFLTFQYIFSKPKQKDIFTINVKENGDIDSCNLNIHYDDYKADLSYKSGTNITISIKGN